MKCPICGTELTPAGRYLYCPECKEYHPMPTVNCAHEPANFSREHGNVTYRVPALGPSPANPESHLILDGDFINITLPYHVCRLCGVFYTDLDAVAAGEKKYKEAQETK